METAAIVVAVAFGAVMGWGLARSLDDTTPLVVALVAGVAAGAVVWLAGLGPDPAFVGGSLVLGCSAGLAAIAPRLARS